MYRARYQPDYKTCEAGQKAMYAYSVALCHSSKAGNYGCSDCKLQLGGGSSSVLNHSRLQVKRTKNRLGHSPVYTVPLTQILIRISSSVNTLTQILILHKSGFVGENGINISVESEN